MATTSRLCLICGQVFGSDAERTAHIAAEHPGERIAWHDKRPWHVTADGIETRIGAAALKRMRATARKVTGPVVHRSRLGVTTRPAAVDPTPAASPAPAMVETPTDDPDAPPYFAQDVPPMFAAGGSSVGPVPTIDGSPAIIPPVTPAPITREAIKLALDQPMLAEMIRNLSVVISDWDGAGEAGQFSRIEAGQLAMLLHDPTIDAVQRFFGGNVNRFRLALAAGIILLGKGRIHARAIQSRRLASVAADTPDDTSAAWTATVPDAPVAVAPVVYDDPVAELAARQRAWNTTPRGDA